MLLLSKGPLKNYLHGATLGNKYPSPMQRRDKRGEIHLWLHGADLIHLWACVPAGRCLLVWDQRGRDAAYFPTSLCTVSAVLLASGKEKRNATKGRGSRLEGKKKPSEE